MRTMLVSDFKAKAIATLKRVKQTGEPVLVTLRGKPLAEVVPVQPKDSGKGIGFGKGRGLIKRRPADDELVRCGFASEWEMNA